MKWLTMAVLMGAGCMAWAQDPNQPVVVDNGMLLWDQCGGEGDRACGVTDPAFFQLPFFVGSFFRCDRTLDPTLIGSQTVCVDHGRRSSAVIRARLTPRLKSQQSDQLGRLSADLPIRWVPMLGTHNSYSNRQDGGNNQVNLDQELTITDQTWLGARHVRLDPVRKIDSSSTIVCHASSFDISGNNIVNFLQSIGVSIPNNETELCATEINSPAPAAVQGFFSYGRPFYLALREVKVWLDRNPGEVIILNINNFYKATESGYLDPVKLNAIVQHELGSKLLRYPEFTAYGAGNDYPTIRQMRTMGKQVLTLMGDSGVPSSTTVAWPNSGNSFPGNSTDRLEFSLCLDHRYPGYPIGKGRIPTFENIGEDRSLSNLGNPAGQRGLVGPLEVETAMACGYSMVALDYFYALDGAPKVSLPPFFTLDYTGGVQAPCGDCDPRPKFMIWSWNPPEDVLQSLPATLQRPPVVFPQIPYYLTVPRAYRWTQASPGTNLPYACAGPDGSITSAYTNQPVFPAYGHPLNYAWTVTTATGSWQNGEQACQEISAKHHFWRPMTSPENQQLAAAMDAAGVQRVWLNHYPRTTIAQPSDLVFDYNNGAPAPAAKSLVVSSGFGGKLTAQFTPNPGAPAFATVTQDNPGGFLFYVSLDTGALANSTAGSYSGLLQITETHPEDGTVTTSNAKVTVNYTRSAFGLTATPAAVDFTAGNTQVVAINSTGPAIAFSGATTNFNWLTIQYSGSTTPATVTFTANPALAPRQGQFGVSITPTDQRIPRITIPFSIATSVVTVNTSGAAIPVSIDGVDVTPPASRTWVNGSSHQLIARPSFPANGAVYTFTGWSDGVPGTTRTVVPAGDVTLTANYTKNYPLQLTAQPANGGTVTVQNPSMDGNYAAGSTITLVATPAPGFVFKQFTGDSLSQASPAALLMDSAKSVQGVFAASQGKTTLNTAPAGLSLTVDGVTYATPVSFVWAVGETHSVQAPTQLLAGSSGTRFVANFWSDGTIGGSRSIGGSAIDVTYTANFFTENLLTLNVSPSNAGTVTGGGWYRANQFAALQATPNTGFTFVNWSGSANAPQNPLAVVMNSPMTVTGNFQAIGTPLLYASSSARTDLGNGTVAVPLVLTNLGSGPAGDAILTSIDTFVVPQGAGAVSAIIPAPGIAMGTIAAGGKAQTVVNFQWPSSATRVSFTVRFTANNGAYKGSTTITLYR